MSDRMSDRIEHRADDDDPMRTVHGVWVVQV